MDKVPHTPEYAFSISYRPKSSHFHSPVLPAGTQMPVLHRVQENARQVEAPLMRYLRKIAVPYHLNEILH